METQSNKCSSSAKIRLYEAALLGDVPSLLNLLNEDPLILDRCMVEKLGCFMQSPLHVAASIGHFEFTKKILNQKPQLAELIDSSNKSSPLHVASAKGHLEIVKLLIEVSPSLCLARDRDGRNPFHVAAMNGQVQVLEVLLLENPHAALERANGGETVLHLCVKYKQPMTMVKIVLDLLEDEGELLNSKDDDGNTVLHIAVIGKQPEIVELLLARPRIDKDGINEKGMTVVDTHKQSRKNMNDERIWKSLKDAKALPAKNLETDHTWLENQRNSLMVVASLIATMAFQVGINPPGGVWQDNVGNTATAPSVHKAGISIWSYDKHDFDIGIVLVSNTIGLMSSLSVILLLICGLPSKRFFVFILRITLWISVTATAITYFTSVIQLINYYSQTAVLNAIIASFIIWLCLMALILLGHVVRFVRKNNRWHKKRLIVLALMIFVFVILLFSVYH